MPGRFVVTGLIALGVLLPAGSTADDPRFVFHGACYCRRAAQLDCIEQLTRAECYRQCAEALCDDWFWLERRPCWNWGYGG